MILGKDLGVVAWVLSFFVYMSMSTGPKSSRRNARECSSRRPGGRIWGAGLHLILHHSRSQKILASTSLKMHQFCYYNEWYSNISLYSSSQRTAAGKPECRKPQFPPGK